MHVPGGRGIYDGKSREPPEYTYTAWNKKKRFSPLNARIFVVDQWVIHRWKGIHSAYKCSKNHHHTSIVSKTVIKWTYHGREHFFILRRGSLSSTLLHLPLLGVLKNRHPRSKPFLIIKNSNSLLSLGGKWNWKGLNMQNRLATVRNNFTDSVP